MRKRLGMKFVSKPCNATNFASTGIDFSTESVHKYKFWQLVREATCLLDINRE